MRLRVAGSLVKHGYVQLAPHTLMDLVHPAAKGIHPSQQAQGLVIYLLALTGQGKARAPPAAQTQAQAGFQVLDMAADRGHTDIELQLGSGHATALDHAFEHPQQPDVHVAQLAQGGPALYLHELTTK